MTKKDLEKNNEICRVIWIIYKFLNSKVRDFEWEDHHAPPVNTLFEICE